MIGPYRAAAGRYQSVNLHNARLHAIDVFAQIGCGALRLLRSSRFALTQPDRFATGASTRPCPSANLKRHNHAARRVRGGKCLLRFFAADRFQNVSQELALLAKESPFRSTQFTVPGLCSNEFNSAKQICSLGKARQGLLPAIGEGHPPHPGDSDIAVFVGG